MSERRSGKRFQVRSRSRGILRVVHDVYVVEEPAECIAFSAQPVAPGEHLTLMVQEPHGVRAYRGTVNANRSYAIGRELRYQLSLQLGRAHRGGDPQETEP
jgi:hypothetical protein